MNKYPITPPGLERMNEELLKLKNQERPRIIIAIAEAKAQGDLSENAEYTSAKEEQGLIEARIADLESKISLAEVIIPSEVISDKIQFGATVTLLDSDTDEEKTYLIVGDYESDIMQGKLSIFSPLASALLGKKKGDEVEVQTPRGTKYYTIEVIKYN